MVTESEHSIVIADLATIPEDGVEWQHPDDPLLSIVLFQRQGTVYAYRDVCPHQGRPFGFGRVGQPRRFLLDPQKRLVCPHHGAVFEVENGHCISGPCRGASLRSIPIRVENGQIVISADEFGTPGQ